MMVEVIMLKQVVTIKEMRMIEQKTFKNQHISSFDLMIKVGKKMFQRFLREKQKMTDILIICGLGNNGGDALVFGEEAHQNGYKVTAVMIGDAKNQTSESSAMTNRYFEKNIPFQYANSNKEFQQIINQLSDIDLIIDGIFGIGCTRNVEGLYLDVIGWINKQENMIISIDIPSGLHADTGKIMGIAVKANVTYAVHAYKQGLLLEDAMDCTNEIIVIDADMEEIENEKYMMKKFSPMPKRPHNSHKYYYKNVLTIGGQKGVMGAITLAGYSALNAGAGLSTVATNIENQQNLIQTIPELMYEVINDVEDTRQLLIKKDAVLFGLGARKTTPFEEMIYEEITNLEIPIVLDANGIQLLKKNKIRKNTRIVITPHYGEFSKLMDIEVKELKENLLYFIQKCIKTYDCEIILKGSTTIYATKKQIIYLNQGTSALAKAGSGDVLSGIILTYLARNIPLEQGVLVHMLAGQEASKTKHIESVLASDIISHIPLVYKKVSKGEYT